MDMILVNDESDDDVEEGLIRKRPINNGVIDKEEKLYVAVGKKVKESESLLLWAIQNSGGRTICILHVYQPDGFIPILGKKYHWSSLEEHQVQKYREIERQLMLKNLDEYLHICRQLGVLADKLYTELDSVENGILQLITRNNIEKIVVGAAADDNCYTEMKELRSRKAMYLLRHAPASCHFWFICKGHLVHQSEGHSQVGAYVEYERSANSKRIPVMGQSEIYTASSQELLVREGSSSFSSRSPPNVSRETTIAPVELLMGPSSEINYHHQLISLGHIVEEKSFEDRYVDEVRKRKELEEQIEKLEHDQGRLREELRTSRDQIFELENKVANYDLVMKDLEDGIISYAGQLQICEKERDDLKIERDNVLKTAEELLNQSADSANEINALKFFSTLTFAEIERVTNYFDTSTRLWESENMSIYQGSLSGTQVTVKVYHPEASALEGPGEFHPEVAVLSKYRHPNIVTLMGVCPDACALVYEYFPNGNLGERLQCKDNAPPVPWTTRIRIATELCSALIFLHADVLQKVVHGSLKPASILLDSNFTCKISDFGFSHIIPQHESSVHTEFLCSSAYTDPQFFTTGQVSPEMDVYSFGLIVLELLTGEPAYGTVDELKDALDRNNFVTLLDTSAGDWPIEQTKQLAKVALRCCAEDANDRPYLRSDVWSVLEPMRASIGDFPSFQVVDEEHHQVPSHFICPISQDVMEDPHIAADGHSYEAASMREWIAGHNTSPLTNLTLENLSLVPNHALRSVIQEWVQRHPTAN